MMVVAAMVIVMLVATLAISHCDVEIQHDGHGGGAHGNGGVRSVMSWP